MTPVTLGFSGCPVLDRPHARWEVPETCDSGPYFGVGEAFGVGLEVFFFLGVTDFG